MPDLKISQLPVATTPLAGTELVPLVQGGVTVQSTVDKVLTGTVPSGTANGVLFLNGSKVVSSGSALTFDGTNFNAPAAIVSGSIGMLYGNTFSAGNSQTWLTNNATASDTYRTADTAQRIRMLTGIGFAWETAASGSIGGAISWSEQMRLDSTGLGIGTSSPGNRLHVAGASTTQVQVQMSGQADMRIISDTGYGALSLESAMPLLFRTSALERMRLDSSGNLGLGGSAARATTVGSAVLNIFNGTAPVGTLANGISLYSDAGEAYVMDAAGNATLISPHDAETNQWIFRSKHTPTGKVLKIDVERLLRFVNDHFGLDAVQEFVEA